MESISSEDLLNLVPGAIEHVVDELHIGKFELRIVFFSDGGETLKDDAFDVVKEFKNRNIKLSILTGDNEASANKVKEILEIDECISNVYPKDKKLSGKIDIMHKKSIDSSISFCVLSCLAKSIIW